MSLGFNFKNYCPVFGSKTAQELCSKLTLPVDGNAVLSYFVMVRKGKFFLKLNE